MAFKGYFIQYKFFVPESTKHSSYNYQKLFRALYGYTQNVSKSSGKMYKYHRPGVLSASPYIRTGKNCVIVPQGVLNRLTNFFKTGQNPTHYWRDKGDWKAEYYMDEKFLGEPDALAALEDLLDRSYVRTTSKEHENLGSELAAVAEQLKRGAKPDTSYAKLLLAEAEHIINNTWFKECRVSQSPKLSKFYGSYKAVKGP